MANSRIGILLLAATFLSGIGTSKTSASVVRQLTDAKSASPESGFLDDAGTTVWVVSSTHQHGGNPSFTPQIFRFDATTGALQQRTSFSEGVVPGPVTVSDDNQWLAFVSRGDLAGANHDQSPELFVMRSDGTGLAQVTNDPVPNAGSVDLAFLSGDGTTIVFSSNADYLGTNTTHWTELFAVQRDGSGLRQLTTAGAAPGRIRVNDAATRIVFESRSDLTGQNPARRSNVFEILSDGTGLRQLTVSADPNDVSFLGGISGNGAKVAYGSTADPFGTNLNRNHELYVVNWDGTGLKQLTKDTIAQNYWNVAGSLSDDGTRVFFSSDQRSGTNTDGNTEVWKIGSDGRGLAALTTTTFQPGCREAEAAGSGNRVAFVASGGALPGGSNPDKGKELAIVDSSGTGARQLTITVTAEARRPDVTPDGACVVFVSDADLTGGNASRTPQLFRMQADGSGTFQVTSLASGSVEAPSVSHDGQTIVFVHDGNPTGGNADGSAEVFTIRADGTGLRQLTSGSGISSAPMISGNGSVVVFQSASDLVTGQNADGSEEIFTIGTDGTGLRQLTADADFWSIDPRVDDGGTWVVFASEANLDGGNPGHAWVIDRIRTDGTGLERVSPAGATFSESPDISGSGDRLVFTSNADPLGTNPAHLRELFSYDPALAVYRQLTFGDGAAGYPRISQDGAAVFFVSRHPYAEDDPDPGARPYRALVASGGVEAVGAMARGNLGLSSPWKAPWIATDAHGTLAVFFGEGDFTDTNPDGHSEIWLADLARPSDLRIGSGPAPTRVSWDFEAGPVRYDVVRGDVANLQLAGDVVDIGPVRCVENDSPDADTAGNDDDIGPAPGQAFFYLVRGSLGLAHGPGSWGRGSSGAERIAGTGSCAD